MKAQKQELDVDFIGEEKPLTEAEEQALSEYFKKKHSLKARKTVNAQPPRSLSKTTA